jgi:hypothetical protein
VKGISACVRWIVTVALLVAIYRGSRGALVAVLFLQALWNELVALIVRRTGLFKAMQ